MRCRNDGIGPQTYVTSVGLAEVGWQPAKRFEKQPVRMRPQGLYEETEREPVPIEDMLVLTCSLLASVTVVLTRFRGGGRTAG